MSQNECTPRMFCGCLGQPCCEFHTPGDYNICLFYNEHKGWCFNPEAVRDGLVRKGFIPQEGGSGVMAIAKYRKAEYPGEWFLTDFTMEQVEGRLAALESDNARLREALRECVYVLNCVICPRGGAIDKAINKANEVLVDE